MTQLIDSIICGVTFLLTFIIFINTNKVNIKANQWFGAFIFCIFLLFLESILLETNRFKEDDFVFELLSLSSFTITPIFYLSISYFVEPVKKWKLIDFFHFGFAFLILLLITLSHLVDEKVETEEINAETYSNVALLFNILFSLQVIPYCIVAYLKILKHQKNIRLINSTVENIDLLWLKNIIISVLVIAVFWVLDIVFSLSEKYIIYDFASSLIYLFVVLYITFYWLKQKEIFPFNLSEKKEIETIIYGESFQEYNTKKNISDEKLELLKIELLEIMNTKKPFLESDLSLVKLAMILNISSHQLSYLINKGFEENFYQFINSFRVEEAKKLILDPKKSHLTMLGIGFEVGFNSKTVFNTTFKKITGLTPSEFKNKNN